MQRKGLHSILEFSIIYKLIQSLFYHKKSKDIFFSFIGNFSNKNILDIGCGPGDFSKNFYSANYFGLDISYDYIRSARKNYGNYKMGWLFSYSYRSADVYVSLRS